MQERAAEAQHEKKLHDNLYRTELGDDMFMVPQLLLRPYARDIVIVMDRR